MRCEDQGAVAQGAQEQVASAHGLVRPTPAHLTTDDTSGATTCPWWWRASVKKIDVRSSHGVFVSITYIRLLALLWQRFPLYL